LIPSRSGSTENDIFFMSRTCARVAATYERSNDVLCNPEAFYIAVTDGAFFSKILLFSRRCIIIINYYNIQFVGLHDDLATERGRSIGVTWFTRHTEKYNRPAVVTLDVGVLYL
jgi:hypothetical protein